MGNAAMVLGVIGGVVGMVVGFFGYGFGELWAWFSAMLSDVSPEAAARVAPEDDPIVTKLISLFAPIAGIAGGAMVHSQKILGAALLGGSAVGMFHGFGFGVFTMFPIAMCGLAALFALLARGDR
ncbi:MAG: hypothetical protein AAFS07_07650 [Pseudomonadota bacterium]